MRSKKKNYQKTNCDWILYQRAARQTKAELKFNYLLLNANFSHRSWIPLMQKRKTREHPSKCRDPFRQFPPLLLLRCPHTILLLVIFHSVNDTFWYSGSRNLTESQQTLWLFVFWCQSLRIKRLLQWLWLCCHADANRRVDGETVTACTRHRLVSFANTLCGYCGIVFNFQQRRRKQSLSPVCLTAGHLHHTQGFVA